MAGLLLLGRTDVIAHYAPTHQIAFQVIGTDKEIRVNDWFREPLLNALEQIETRFRNLNKEREARVGLVRLGIPDYSPDAFREALLNAVQHRNYAILNSVYVQLHTDHLFIASPGGFPRGITLENLLVHEPRARNGGSRRHCGVSAWWKPRGAALIRFSTGNSVSAEGRPTTHAPTAKASESF